MISTLKFLAPNGFVPVLIALKIILAFVFSAGAQDQQSLDEQVEVRKTYDAWEVVCVKDTENCVMQQIGKSERGDDALRVRITRLEAESQDGKPIPASVEIVVPLGVVLPAGLRFKIDDQEPRGARFAICLRVGCIAQDAMSDEFIQDLKKGSSAEVIVVLPPNRDIGVGLSLKGFTKAYDSLRPLRPENLALPTSDTQ